METSEYLKVISTKVFTKSKNSKLEFQKSLQTLIALLNINVDIDIERDELQIYSTFYKSKKVKSLAEQYPNIALEWHPEKNGSLSPYNVDSCSGLKVWWKCSRGHEWKTYIYSRTKEKSSGCPFCSGHRLLNGVNDLLTCFPEIAEEWHFVKNGTLTPSDVSQYSSKIVWWKGKKCEHEWQTSINNRTGINKTKCPYCSNEKILKGFNDLQTRFPDIASEWHPFMNGNLKSTDVMGGTVKKVWWICLQGHSYQASPHCRTSLNTGCPYCAHVRLLSGFNDLQTCFPEIAEEWHPTLNGKLTPNTVAKSSNKKVWWKCKKQGHEWLATINSRTGKLKPGCPICAGRKIKK
jgi:hypothetical protein